MLGVPALVQLVCNQQGETETIPFAFQFPLNFLDEFSTTITLKWQLWCHDDWMLTLMFTGVCEEKQTGFSRPLSYKQFQESLLNVVCSWKLTYENTK